MRQTSDNLVQSVGIDIVSTVWAPHYDGPVPSGLSNGRSGPWWTFPREVHFPSNHTHSDRGRHRHPSKLCRKRVWRAGCFPHWPRAPLAKRICSLLLWDVWVGWGNAANILGRSDWEHHPGPWQDQQRCAVYKVQVSFFPGLKQGRNCIFWRRVDEGYHGSHLIFTPTGGAGCYSSVGRDLLGRGQYINLGSPECLAIGTIIHETLHSLGLIHRLYLNTKKIFQVLCMSNRGLIGTSMSLYCWIMCSLVEKQTSGKRDLRPSTLGTCLLTTKASCFILLTPLGKKTVLAEGGQRSSLWSQELKSGKWYKTSANRAD